jgi:peptide/nickel transport system substrate-binding protein
LRIWPDQTAVVNALINGEVDAASLVPSDVETIEGTEGLQVANYPTRSFTFYATNLDETKSELFLDPAVRKALLVGLDREAITNDILLGNAIVAHGTQPVISYAYAPDRITTQYNYDPELAKQHLADAGWTDGDGDGIVEKDGQPLAFEMIYPSGTPTTEQIVAYMQDAWRGIGVDMTPRALEFPALVEIITGDRNFDIAMLGFSWDATFIQDAMFGCEQVPPGGFNMQSYCNEKVDELNAAAKRTFDEEARAELIIEATNVVNDDLPVAVMHFSRANIGYSDRLQNFEPSAWGVDLNYVWIQQ